MKRIKNISQMIYRLVLQDYIQAEDLAALVNHCFLSKDKGSWERGRVKQRKTHYKTCQGSVAGIIQAAKASISFDTMDLDETMGHFGVPEELDTPAGITFQHKEEESEYVADKLLSRGKPEAVQDYLTFLVIMARTMQEYSNKFSEITNEDISCESYRESMLKKPGGGNE